MRKYIFGFFASIVLLPQIGFAAVSCSTLANDTFSELVGKAICIINTTLIPLLFALATLIFLIGLVKFVANGADEEARKKGKDFIIWGIIAMVVMVSIWGLIRVVTSTLDLNNDPNIKIPEAPVFTPAG